MSVGALQGSLFTVRSSHKKDFDIVGAMAIAVVMGLGGGILRDVLLAQPIAALGSNAYLVTALVAGTAGLLFIHIFERISKFFIVFDTVALSLFVLVGVQKASILDKAVLPAIIAGTITGIGGGILRDIFADDSPAVLLKSTYYAVAAVAGSTMFVILNAFQADLKVTAIASVMTTIVLRFLSIRLKLDTPRARSINIKNIKAALQKKRA